MSRYTTVESFIWHDEKFRSLPEDARTVFLYLLTCPHGNMCGIFYLPDLYAASDLQWDVERYRKAIDTLCDTLLIAKDKDIIWIKNYLKHNPIKGPKQITGAVNRLMTLPDTKLIGPFMKNLEKHLLEDDVKLFKELYTEPYEYPSDTLSDTPSIADTDTDTDTDTERITNTGSKSETGGVPAPPAQRSPEVLDNFPTGIPLPCPETPTVLLAPDGSLRAPLLEQARRWCWTRPGRTPESRAELCPITATWDQLEPLEIALREYTALMPGVPLATLLADLFVTGEARVEFAAAHDVPVLRVDGVAGPLQLQLAPHAGGAQPAVAVVLGERRAEAHLVQLVDGTRRQPVAARLLARERLSFHDRDVVAVLGQPVAGGGTGGVPACSAGGGTISLRSLTFQRYSSACAAAQVDPGEAGCKDSFGAVNRAHIPGELFVCHRRPLRHPFTLRHESDRWKPQP